MASKVVNVQLTHRKACLLGGFAYDKDLNNLLRYRKPGWDWTPSGKAYIHNKAAGVVDPLTGEPYGWDGYIHLMRDGEMGAGVFLAKKDEIEKTLSVRFKIKDQRLPLAFGPEEVTDLDKEGRVYQLECVEAMVNASMTGGLVLQATGSGKTYTTGKFFRRLKGNALFLVDELTLLKQAQDELGSVLGEDIGVIGNSVFDPKRITVGTIQTVHLHRRDKSYSSWTKSLKVIIIDEVHLALNRRNFQTVRVINPPAIFGLTATLELRKKHIAMQAYDLCGPVIYQYPLSQGVEEGYLSRGVAVQVLCDSGKPAPVRRGNKRFWFLNRMLGRKDYQKEYREYIVENEKRNQLILDLVEASHNQSKYIIVLVERVKHLQTLSAMFEGIPHLLLYGDKSVEERVEGKDLFEKGKVRVILTNKIFKKGVNIKRVDVILDGAAMKSKNDAAQKYGRGVRLSDEKLGLIYFDLSDKGNRFEKAAKSRASALKKLGVPIYKADSDLGAEKILRLAQKKLEEVVKQP